MIRQYHAQRRQGGDNPLGIGVIPTGAIFYLQPEWWWRDRYRSAPDRRDPHIVEAFLNGTMGAARRNPETGLWEDAYMARRSDFAVLRSLRDGRRRTIAVRALLLHEDEGLRADPMTYPTLPKIAPRRGDAIPRPGAPVPQKGSSSPDTPRMNQRGVPETGDRERRAA